MRLPVRSAVKSPTGPLQPGRNGSWHLNLEQLEASLTARTRMLVINFPHNPTGYTLARAELDAIIGLARKHGLILFSDEMYRLLEYDPSAQLPPICDLYEKGISLSGLSKSLCLARPEDRVVGHPGEGVDRTLVGFQGLHHDL